MPQNKSTSRIATITGKLAVALAALLAPAILIAETTNVTFNAALTNETGWTYSEGVKIASDMTYVYFNKGGESIRSPQFPFAITNISLNISCSSANPSRKLSINIAENVEIEVPNVCEANKSEWKSFNLKSTDCVRSFTLSSKGSSGSWRLYTATISGAPIVPPPTELQASDIRGDRFTLSWENPETAVSNRIAMMEIVESEITGVTIEYDFNEFTNSQKSSVDITDSFTNTIPAFSGSSEIRLPASTNGIIQISKDGARGYFVHSRFADYSDMSLVISLRVPNEDSKKTFGVSYLAADGSTNQFCQIAMSTEFITNTVSLASVPPNAPLLFNTDGTSDAKRVVYVDYMAFIGATAVNIATNVVATAFAAGSPVRVKRLSPNTEYLVTVSAFDPDGNESSPSEPLAVTTNGEAIPFSIRIQ